MTAPGEAPYELARRIAHAVVCAVIPSGWVVPAIKHEAAVAAARELAKVVTIPAETLDQVELAMQAMVDAEEQAMAEWDAEGAPPWQPTHPAMIRLRALVAAIEALRAARSEKSR